MCFTVPQQTSYPNYNIENCKTIILHVYSNDADSGVDLDEMMDEMRFYVLSNSISIISGRWKVDNERLCAMELRLRLRRFRLKRASNSVR